MDIRDWIANHAARRPGSIAQLDHATGRSFTYAEMNQRVSRIAGYLESELGIKPGEVIAVLGHNSSDIFDIDFACGRMGAIFLPMNTRLTAPELGFQLKDAGAKAIFVGGGFMEIAKEAIACSTLSPPVIAFGQQSGDIQMEDMIVQAPDYSGAFTPDASTGWTLIYSSGTTGRPKGVLHTHGGVTMQAIANCVPLGLGPQSVGMTILPLFHISGLNIFAHAMFYAGAKQITLEKFDPSEMLDVLSDRFYGVTHFSAVPTIFELMAQMPGFEEADTSTVEGAFVGGAASTLSLLETYAAKGMPLIQGYGLTESGPTLTVLDAKDAIARIGSAGKPIMHVDLMVVDDDGKEVPAGMVGEIIARGPSVITEYFNRPEAQASSFYGQWLRTGDMGHFDDDGFLYIVDRKKDMFISGGENVYPAEVENCIAGLEGVVQAAVIGVADDKWGEVGVACIVKSSSSDIGAADIIDFCDGKLARYKIPKQVHFFEALPVGGTGKVLKTALRDHFLKGDNM